MILAWMVVATAIFVFQAVVTVLIVSELRALRSEIRPSLNSTEKILIRTAEKLGQVET